MHFEFIISDTGIGMSKEFAEHIFEPFAQEDAENRSSYRGTGLGMSIVKNLISKMKGSITLHTVKGEGTYLYYYSSCEVRYRLYKKKKIQKKLRSKE